MIGKLHFARDLCTTGQWWFGGRHEYTFPGKSDLAVLARVTIVRSSEISTPHPAPIPPLTACRRIDSDRDRLSRILYSNV